MIVEDITMSTFDRALKQQEKKNLNSTGSSLSWVSMKNKLYKHIYNIHDNRIITINEEWRVELLKL